MSFNQPSIGEYSSILSPPENTDNPENVHKTHHYSVHLLVSYICGLAQFTLCFSDKISVWCGYPSVCGPPCLNFASDLITTLSAGKTVAGERRGEKGRGGEEKDLSSVV